MNTPSWWFALVCVVTATTVLNTVTALWILRTARRHRDKVIDRAMAVAGRALGAAEHVLHAAELTQQLVMPAKVNPHPGKHNGAANGRGGEIGPDRIPPRPE